MASLSRLNRQILRTKAMAELQPDSLRARLIRLILAGDFDAPAFLVDMEKELCSAALCISGGHRTVAAKWIGLKRNTFAAMLKRLGLTNFLIEDLKK